MALFLYDCILRLAISTHVYFAKNAAYFPFNSWLSFQRLCRLLWGYNHGQTNTQTHTHTDKQTRSSQYFEPISGRRGNKSRCVISVSILRCGCTACHEDQFRCNSTALCIPTSWICDGEDDCEDSSDESNCTAGMRYFLCHRPIGDILE